MRDRARNFDAEQACDAKQKPEETRHEGTPNENPHIPVGTGTQFRNPGGFPEKQHKRSNEDRRARVCPVCELNRGVIAVWQRGLDKDCVDRNGQRRKYPIK
jgi:hypothetical protein